jgi:hypothetical protein
MRRRSILVIAGVFCVSPLLGELVLAQAPAAPAAPRGQAPVIQRRQPKDAGPAPRSESGKMLLDGANGKVGLWTPMFGVTDPILEFPQVPFQPWAKALYEVRQKVGDKDDPHARCLPPGGPRQFQTPNGFEFIEQADRKRITIIFGGGPRSWRFIYLDGRPLPSLEDLDLIPTYFGYSTGKWEGDTLVVESTGYNEKFWFHRGGLPHTDALHLTERFSRPDFDTLRYEVTVDDPKAYTRPWTGGFTVPWTYTNWDGSPGGEMHEYLCQDNERDYTKLR